MMVAKSMYGRVDYVAATTGMITCMMIFPPSTSYGEYATPMRLVKDDDDDEEPRVSVEK
jgi:hypothetical protein